LLYIDGLIGKITKSIDLALSSHVNKRHFSISYRAKRKD